MDVSTIVTFVHENKEMVVYCLFGLFSILILCLHSYTLKRARPQLWINCEKEDESLS